MPFSLARELGGAGSAHTRKVAAGLAVFGEESDSDEDTRAGRLQAALGAASLSHASPEKERQPEFQPHHSKPQAIVRHNSSAFADTPPQSDDESSPKASQMPAGSAAAARHTMTDGLAQDGSGGCGTRRMSQRLQFSEAELRRMHKLFHRYAPDGNMREAEFKKYMQEQSGLKADAEESYEQIFRAYDRNKDGTIVFREYLEYLHGIRFSTSELIDIVFSTFDADSDGFVTRDELVKAVTNSTRWKGELDVSSGSAQELIGTEVDKIISYLDTDKDGKVSTHELASAAQAHPEVLEALRQLI
eukprot:TRINITY_DN6401_c0_g1_i1.p1 TRINITY_DN6401_c0_g1~~TRINITY_DN6401_c0_g1_i1.p1  ORF type:complete len:302 (+),score=129.46 TRINITY_DN6401_c0_g1_i1:83-988(+)